MDPASGSPSPSRFDGLYTIDKNGKWQKITDSAKMVEVEPILKCVENTLNNSSKTDCEECKGYLEALKTRVKKHLETKWWTAIPFLGKYLLSWAQKKVDNQFTPIQAAIQQKLLAPDLPVNVARIKVEQSVTTTTEMRKPFYGSANEYVTSLFRQGLEKGFDSKERYGVFDEFPQDAKPKAHEDESKTLFLSPRDGRFTLLLDDGKGGVKRLDITLYMGQAKGSIPQDEMQFIFGARHLQDSRNYTVNMKKTSTFEEVENALLEFAKNPYDR